MSIGGSGAAIVASVDDIVLQGSAGMPTPPASQTLTVVDSTGATFTGTALVFPNATLTVPTTGANAGKVVVVGFGTGSGAGDTF